MTAGICLADIRWDGEFRRLLLESIDETTHILLGDKPHQERRLIDDQEWRWLNRLVAGVD